MPTLKQQRDLLVEQLKRTLQPEVLGAGHQVAERLADVYLGIDSGGTFFGAVSGFGPGAYVNETFGGLKGLADYLVKGGKIQTQNISAGPGGKTRPVLAPSQAIPGAREAYSGQSQTQTRSLATIDQTAPLGSAERTRQLLEQGRELGQIASRYTRIPFEEQNTLQGQNMAPGNVPGGQLRPEEQNTLGIIEQWLQKLTQSGYTINPQRIAQGITEKDMADLLTRAQKEVEPFYASALNLAKENLLQDFGWGREDILRYEKSKEQELGRRFENIGAEEAETGTALSGRRIQRELMTQQETGEDIASKRRQLQRAGIGELGTFAQKYGGRELPSLTLPEAPTISGGRFQYSGRESPFYETGPALERVIGTQQKERALETETTYRGFLENLRQERELGLRSLQL